MKRIESIKDLRSERARLNLKLIGAEEAIREDIEWIKSELKPVHIAGKFLSNSFINKDNGLINQGVRSVINTLLKSVVLSRSGWITRLIVPFLVKNISSNFILEKKPELFGILKNFISSARRRISKTEVRQDIHNHFDKSTADEMKY